MYQYVQYVQYVQPIIVGALESDVIAARDGEDHLGFYRAFYVQV